MLKEIKHIIENPEDIPGIPDASATYLHARLNPTYLMRTGVVDELRRAGFSEAYVAGFLDGCNAAVEVVELMDESQRQEGDPNVL